MLLKYHQHERTYFLLFQSDEMSIPAMIDLTNILNTDMQKAVETYNILFEE